MPIRKWTDTDSIEVKMEKTNNKSVTNNNIASKTFPISTAPILTLIVISSFQSASSLMSRRKPSWQYS